MTRSLWWIANGKGGLWLGIIRRKYLHGQPLAFCHRSGGSQFWQFVIQLLPVLRIETSIVVGSGTSTLFWFDQWAGEDPFAARFPGLLATTVDPRISVKAALIDLGHLTFQRPFGPPDIISGHELLETVALHEPDLDQIVDCISSHLEPSGKFSMKSLCWAITATPASKPLELIWSIRLPLKIRIFLWQWIRSCVPSGVEVLKSK
ncbi:hypothetical protein ZWY2020_034151 [Hordeum vulgare]|nr:hypothetical protein ZWY2020_034151 [Hordeum vulgare]